MDPDPFRRQRPPVAETNGAELDVGVAIKGLATSGRRQDVPGADDRTSAFVLAFGLERDHVGELALGRLVASLNARLPLRLAQGSSTQEAENKNSRRSCVHLELFWIELVTNPLLVPSYIQAENRLQYFA